MADHAQITAALLRLQEVTIRVGLGKTAIYARISAGVFPRPVTLGERCVRWRAEDIERWLAEPLPLPKQS